MTDTSALFRPFKLRNTEFRNRFAMAPMTRGFSPDGIPGDDVRAYYQRRAENEVGLIISEGTLVPRDGAANEPNYPLFYGDALNGWANVINAVHDAGGKMAPQIWHVGMVRKPGTGHNPDAKSDSPSGVTHTGKQVMDAPTTAEVEDMINAYIAAAASAVELGFDAVEIHGAHGYLIDQFFWMTMNKRDDQFGGDFVDRVNFAAEIIKGIRDKIGDTPLLIRWSQWKQQEYTARLVDNPNDLESFLKPMVDAGIDMFHCSQRRYWEPEFPELDGENGLNLAGWVKKITGVLTMSVGSVGLSGDFFEAFQGKSAKTRPIGDLVERMEKDEFDMIAVGRALLQDPEWVVKVKEGREDELETYDAKALGRLY